MWLNRRSSENAPVRIRLGGSVTGCGGKRSISTPFYRGCRILRAAKGGRRQMPKSRKKKQPSKRVLALPDLEQSKAAVLNSLTSKSGQQTYDRAITDLVDWYCSEPRLAFNRNIVLRYRMNLEQKHYAPTTINLRLAAVRRVAYKAADSGLLSPELAAGIRRVKGVRSIGVRVGNWLMAEQCKRLLASRPGWPYSPLRLMHSLFNT